MSDLDPSIPAPPALDPERPAAPAAMRGARGRCPRCGEGALFDSRLQGFLDVKPACSACRLPLGAAHRADDLPPYLTILVAGHVMVPLVVAVERAGGAPAWVGYGLWPLLAVALCIVLLRPIKGSIVGLQWAWALHGFSGAESAPLQAQAALSPEPRVEGAKAGADPL